MPDDLAGIALFGNVGWDWQNMLRITDAFREQKTGIIQGVANVRHRCVIL